MNILEEIIAKKKEEIIVAKRNVPISVLEKGRYFTRETFSLAASLLDESKPGIIAEFKRKSPSKGIFNENASAKAITRAYTESGASGLSVLTDETFFAGSSQDLQDARLNAIPILRKDFIIDEYQIVEAKSIGADLILLIAACLSPERVKQLSRFASRLNMEVLLEIHNQEELEHINDDIRLIGVNNRDLKTFTVDINRSLELGEKIPSGKIKISESGISDVASISLLKEHGYKGFLIGETFMKEPDPSIAFASFVQKLKLAQHAG